ncbi:MAG TPA: hypothetical protein VMQ76_10720 [Terracidiphilus sp.]|jgi:predicted small lipoprotein YifL|nr:hypothetical protein [Terracidiphilus sp.]
MKKLIFVLAVLTLATITGCNRIGPQIGPLTVRVAPALLLNDDFWMVNTSGQALSKVEIWFTVHHANGNSSNFIREWDSWPVGQELHFSSVGSPGSGSAITSVELDGSARQGRIKQTIFPQRTASNR